MADGMRAGRPVTIERFRLWRADRYFEPRGIEDFDGRGWGGVYLDDTTRDDFKNQYRTKGGNFIRPESTIVTSAPGAPWDIQALQDGTGGKAHITGFHVEFKDGGTSQDRLRGLDRDGGKREEWFPQKRYSDWSVITYPRRGIALLDVREQRDRIPYALLTTPDRLGRMLNGMEDRAPRIEDIRDEFDRMSREVEIGTVTISLTKKDLEPRGGGSRFEDDYRFRARRDIDRGDIRYGAGNAGSVYISVSIYFRDGRNDNHVEVSAQLNGKNERGQVSAFGSGKRDLDRSENRAYGDVDSAISRAYQDAIDDMLDQADRNIRGQKPPSPADYRKLAWIHLFDGPTK